MLKSSRLLAIILAVPLTLGASGCLEDRPDRPTRIDVPNIVGLPGGKARKQLRRSGLEVRTGPRPISGLSEETLGSNNLCFTLFVQEQSPEAGARVKPGTVVTLKLDC